MSAGVPAAVVATVIGDLPALQLMLQAQIRKGKLQRYLFVELAKEPPEARDGKCCFRMLSAVETALRHYERSQPHGAAIRQAVLQVYPVDGQNVCDVQWSWSAPGSTKVRQTPSLMAVETAFKFVPVTEAQHMDRPQEAFRPESVKPVLQALIAAGCDLNQRDFQGMPALCVLPDIISDCLDDQSDELSRGVKEEEDLRPLRLEAATAAMVMLLEAGADPNLRCVQPSPAARWVDTLARVGSAFEPPQLEALLQALKKAGCDFRPLPIPAIDRTFLITPSTTVTDTSRCWLTSLAVAYTPYLAQPQAAARVLQFVRFAVEQGGLDVNTRLPSRGNPPMLLDLMKFGHQSTCLYLLQAGADPRKATTDEAAETALTYVSQSVASRITLGQSAESEGLQLDTEVLNAMHEAVAQLEAQVSGNAAAGPAGWT